MQKKIWEIVYLSLPTVSKYCKKCGKKEEFICSEHFRINAQRKSLDIWLIYKCQNCNSTWNAALYSRISPHDLKPELLDKFYKDDADIIKKYAMNSGLLRKNGVVAGVPRYVVKGDEFSPNELIELEIKCKYACSIKVSSLVREKLQLSLKVYLQLISDGMIRSVPDSNLIKCKLEDGIKLVFGKMPHDVV